jgi:mannose-6-phosphate isomerase-like protein (cupin superfamily)
MNYELIRKVRKAEALTLVELAEKTGYTPSFLSQVERGLKQTSLDAMRKISDCLGISVISLLTETIQTPKIDTSSAQCSITRKSSRNEFTLDENGANYELLTPQDPEGPRRYSMFGTIATIEPGKWANENPISHLFEECCYIISGKMRAIVGDEVHDLESGDSLYLKGFVLHNFQNIGEEDLIIVSVQAK